MASPPACDSEQQGDGTAALTGQRRWRRATRLCLVRILRRGWITIPVALLTQAPLPQGAFLPKPWPAVPAPKRRPLVPELEMQPAAA